MKVHTFQYNGDYGDEIIFREARKNSTHIDDRDYTYIGTFDIPVGFLLKLYNSNPEDGEWKCGYIE
uniref:Uncharacterized protein n=1 Tax=viral metagenome TaxID=1070528 RepID=A0A6M3JIG8_9ZZZZ